MRAVVLPAVLRSENAIVSAMINPFSKSVWMTPAACKQAGHSAGKSEEAEAEEEVEGGKGGEGEDEEEVSTSSKKIQGLGGGGGGGGV